MFARWLGVHLAYLYPCKYISSRRSLLRSGVSRELFHSNEQHRLSLTSNNNTEICFALCRATMLSKILLVLPVVLAGVAATVPDCTPKVICVDGWSECGVPYGG